MSSRLSFPHVVIRASAGTGKTYQLALRFIGLLAAGEQPEEILATTFTRKAAGEILDRVLFRLAQAAGDEGERKKLAAAIGDKTFSAKKCRELLLATVRKLHCLRIGTLDSYFIQVAGSFGQELGLPPGWSIGDELIDAGLRDEAIELVLSHGRLSDLLTLVHSLTKGTAARSVSQLVRDTVGGLFELFRETTPTAWDQIQPPKGLLVAELEETHGAIASFALPEGQLAKTRDKDVEKARRGDWEGFIKSGFGSKILCGETAFNRKPLPVELVGLYRLLLKHVESVLVGQVARQTEATHQLLTRFSEHYRALQLDERVLRFGDVTFRLGEAAEIVGPDRLAFRLDGGIRHVLLDEFQDTAPAQWRIIRGLAQSVTAQPGGSFFCVGDAKQAIYGWRGGVAEIFDALDGELKGLSSSSLATSYRSAQPVIDAVNGVFQNLTKHPNLDKLAEPVAKWQTAFPLHSTARNELAGYVTLSTSPAATEEQDQTDVLFQYAAEQVREVVSQAPQATIGVLVRTNTAVARIIYLLRSMGILASEEGGNPLIDSPVVELILSLLKLADHPGDRVARFHLATSPLAAHLELASERDEAGATLLSRQLRRQLLEEGYGATVFAWATRLAASCDGRDLSRLQQLVELAYDYQPRSTLRADDFIRLVQTKRIADPTSSDVRVMTIHQAKGLQFDVVFLPELNANLAGQREMFVAGRPGPTQPVNVVCRLANEQVRQFFSPPLRKLFDDDMHREVSEALCVLYVAMTRAVHALHMIVPPAAANEKTLRKTYAVLLRATLAPDQPATGGQTLYQAGDPQWFRKVVGTLRVPSADAGIRSVPTILDALRPVAIRLAPPLPQRERGLERTSPSALEGGMRLHAARVLAPRAETSLNIGTLIHAWLEQIEWLDAVLPSDQTLRQIAAQLRSEIGDVSSQLDELIGRFRRQLAAPAITAVLQQSFYRTVSNLGLAEISPRDCLADELEFTVERERRFAIRRGAELLAGSIDRLVVLRRNSEVVAADVIDFKTDELPAGDPVALAVRTEFYRPQIEAYRSGAARLLRISPDRVGGRIVYLNYGIVQSIA